MKRRALVDRVKLPGEKRRGLLVAAGRYADPAFQGEWHRNDRAMDLEVAAAEYAAVMFRYLGGER